jgi:hypothetical protein
MGIGKILIFAGLALVLLGVVFLLLEKAGFGRLPGDVLVRGDNFTFYFPIVSCVLLSILLTVAAWVVQWWRS